MCLFALLNSSWFCQFCKNLEQWFVSRRVHVVLEGGGIINRNIPTGRYYSWFMYIYIYTTSSSTSQSLCIYSREHYRNHILRQYDFTTCRWFGTFNAGIHYLQLLYRAEWKPNPDRIKKHIHSDYDLGMSDHVDWQRRKSADIAALNKWLTSSLKCVKEGRDTVPSKK